MAVIETREYNQKDKKGALKLVEKYKATVTIRGCPRVSKTFDRKTDAEKWAAKTEYEYRNQIAFGSACHRTKTVSDAIDRYSQNLALTNPRRYADIEPQLRWWNERIGKVTLGNVSKDLISHHRDKLKDTHVTHHDEAVAVIFVKEGKVLRFYRSDDFPFITALSGTPVPRTSHFHGSITDAPEMREGTVFGGGSSFDHAGIRAISASRNSTPIRRCPKSAAKRIP